MNKDKIDLGKYDLNKLLRNPAIVHKIQDNILALDGDTFLEMAATDGWNNRGFILIAPLFKNLTKK